jgi:hydroxyacylglutathione hydrolase
MLLRRFYHDGLALASYLLGCQATGAALVIDPNRDLDQYRAAAAEAGLQITAVTETHIHADFVSGARELAARTGARLYLSGAGPAAWQYAFAAEVGATLLHDGDTFAVGNVRVDVWHTPGHTPEHLSFLVTDTRTADRPMGIFTGDFVFVGDVGRPDLLERAAGVTGTADPGARALFGSLQRFRTLPDYVQVGPGHGAGSACGKALGAVPQSTVGYEVRFNWAFNIPDEAGFVTAVLAGQPEPPPYFAQMKRINRDGPARDPAAVPPYGTAADLRQAVAAGMPVVDVRPPARFAAAHWPGTLKLPAGVALLPWAGWLVPYDRPFGLIVDPAQRAAVQATLRLIGLDQVARVWEPTLVETEASAQIRREPATATRTRLGQSEVVVLDTRWADEYAAGHLPGSRNIPLGHLPERLAELPVDHPVLVYCAGGTRSPIAASLLTAHVHAPVIEMQDGFEAWQRAGFPVER